MPTPTKHRFTTVCLLPLLSCLTLVLILITAFMLLWPRGSSRLAPEPSAPQAVRAPRPFATQPKITATAMPTESTLLRTPLELPQGVTEPQATQPQVEEAPLPIIHAESLRVPDTPYIEETQAMKDLEAKLMAFLEAEGLTDKGFSLVYQDLETGERLSYRADARYPAASCIKLPMAMTFAKLVDKGLLAWDSPIRTEVDAEQYIFSEAERAQWGPSATLRELVRPALRNSNNTATSILFTYFRRHQQWLHTVMDKAMGTHYGKDVTLSAKEGADVLYQLARNPEGIEGYGLLLDDLRASSWNHFVTRDLPRAECANKYGQMGGVNHELGLVFGPHPFLYAVMTEGIDAYRILPALGSLLYEWTASRS